MKIRRIAAGAALGALAFVLFGAVGPAAADGDEDRDLIVVVDGKDLYDDGDRDL